MDAGPLGPSDPQTGVPFGYNVTFPQSLKIIGIEAFKPFGGISSHARGKLKGIYFDKNSLLQIIKSHAFDMTNIQNDIIFPASLEKIEYSAFRWCNYGTNNEFTISFEENSKFKHLGGNTFVQSTLSGAINFPNSLQKIEYWAFWSCSRLKNISFNVDSKLEHIGSQSFANTGLYGKLKLPVNLFESGDIASDAFKNTDVRSFEYITHSPTSSPTPAICSMGYYSNSDGICESCDKGTYSDSVGALICTPCPSGI